MAQQEGVTVAVMAFEVGRERIKHIWTVRNPEKLPAVDGLARVSAAQTPAEPTPLRR